MIYNNCDDGDNRNDSGDHNCNNDYDGKKDNENNNDKSNDSNGDNDNNDKILTTGSIQRAHTPARAIGSLMQLKILTLEESH